MKKIFKDKEKAYILTIEDYYIQMTCNNPYAYETADGRYPICSICYTKIAKKYSTMFIENEREIPRTEFVDEFKALLFLETHFSNEAANEFLEACKSI